MGLQTFIRTNITLREELRKIEIEKHGKDTCPECKSNRKDWFRNILGTLECICGRKFHGE
jgi:ribosomal protein L37AE/L43A